MEYIILLINFIIKFDKFTEENKNSKVRLLSCAWRAIEINMIKLSYPIISITCD